jgi:hypothetical protein
MTQLRAGVAGKRSIAGTKINAPMTAGFTKIIEKIEIAITGPVLS